MDKDKPSDWLIDEIAAIHEEPCVMMTPALADLLHKYGVINQWECDFIGSVYHWPYGELSDKQNFVRLRIAEKLLTYLGLTMRPKPKGWISVLPPVTEHRPAGDIPSQVTEHTFRKRKSTP